MTVVEPSYQERDRWNGSEHGWLWATGEGAKKSRRIFRVSAPIDQAAISLGMATLMGACIGFERQWRQRMAGLRTNTLVAIGAASFVIFEGLFPDDGSPTRVAAQVVSGIGFLGAGIIFREGLHVTGLNTAATLWCSAAVGLLAGSGHPLHAALATAFVVLVNLTLRPLVRIINRQPISQAETDFHYRVRVAHSEFDAGARDPAGLVLRAQQESASAAVVVEIDAAVSPGKAAGHVRQRQSPIPCGPSRCL
jgi:uncharacterized membrane protein YhiD involved in acid resistance